MILQQLNGDIKRYLIVENPMGKKNNRNQIITLHYPESPGQMLPNQTKRTVRYQTTASADYCHNNNDLIVPDEINSLHF